MAFIGSEVVNVAVTIGGVVAAFPVPALFMGRFLLRPHLLLVLLVLENFGWRTLLLDLGFLLNFIAKLE